jgi:hypothetical protein
MLKIKLTAAEHAALPDPIKAEYKSSGTDFVLDTDQPFEDVGGLKNALEQEKAAKKKLVTDKQVLEGQVADLTTRAGSATDLEKAWKEKLENAGKQHESATAGLNTQIRKLLVDGVAERMAAELSTSPSLLAPIIARRLNAEMVDGEYVTRVLTSDGKASATSLKELADEVRANKEYAPIIAASKASGGGANGDRGQAGGKPFGKMNEQERVALFKSDPAKYDQLSKAFKAETSGQPNPQPTQ